MSGLTTWKQCGAPGCRRRIQTHYFCCAQHRGLLGFDLSVRLQTDWRERRFDPERYERTRAEAYRKWGCKPEYVECR